MSLAFMFILHFKSLAFVALFDSHRIAMPTNIFGTKPTGKFMVKGTQCVCSIIRMLLFIRTTAFAESIACISVNPALVSTF